MECLVREGSARKDPSLALRMTGSAMEWLVRERSARKDPSLALRMTGLIKLK